MTTTCPICLTEVTPDNDFIVLEAVRPCLHEACPPCLTRWFAHSQQKICPICSQEVESEYWVDLGGAEEVAHSAEATETIRVCSLDDLTRDWLELNGAKQCPDCGIWITKDGGCNHMTCDVCSKDFCWGCLCDYNISECECEDSEDEDQEDDI